MNKPMQYTGLRSNRSMVRQKYRDHEYVIPADGDSPSYRLMATDMQVGRGHSETETDRRYAHR